MKQPIGELPVDDEELLARFVLHRGHIRADGTVKPDAFIPYKYVEMSVTRRLDLEDQGVWEAGELVARQRDIPLVGRADAQSKVYVDQGLRVIPRPLVDNPNHADVIDWPADKPSQKEIALLVARTARYQPKPA